MSRGLTEDIVDKLRDYEQSDLPARTKAALRLADTLNAAAPSVDPEFYEELKQHFTEDQILDLGMCIAFMSGWQHFIEAFGVVPDRWTEGSPMPWERIAGDGQDGASR